MMRATSIRQILGKSVFIGELATVSENDLTNVIAIGQGAVGTASNQVTIGNSSVTSTILQGTVSVSNLTATTSVTTPLLNGVSMANVQIALPTASIDATSCTTPGAVAISGLLTTSTFTTAFASNPNSVSGWGANGGLVFTAWPTAGTLNWSVCNQTSAAITPGAMTLNVGAH